MNNHWGTNYRAYQEGPTVFRFILRPHRAPNPGAATRFAIERSQPLIVAPARGAQPRNQSRLTVESEQVVVNSLKPSDDGKALIVRLFNASERDEPVRLHWGDPNPVEVWQSNTAEEQLQKIGNKLTVPSRGLLTLRAELP
jgi:alpha-mannosidase